MNTITPLISIKIVIILILKSPSVDSINAVSLGVGVSVCEMMALCYGLAFLPVLVHVGSASVSHYSPCSLKVPATLHLFLSLWWKMRRSVHAEEVGRKLFPWLGGPYLSSMSELPGHCPAW